MKLGFDNNKYLNLQSEHIKERIAQFGDKLYLEFGGKLFDDYHASRVLPGFAPDSKLQMLLQLKEHAEIVIAINANHLHDKKIRSDLRIGYDDEVLRLIEEFTQIGLYVGSVVITQYTSQKEVKKFETKLKKEIFRYIVIIRSKDIRQIRKKSFLKKALAKMTIFKRQGHWSL